MKIRSGQAFLIYIIAMTIGFVFSSFKTEAPYLTFATQLTIGFTAYITKRLIQKRKEYNEKEQN